MFSQMFLTAISIHPNIEAQYLRYFEHSWQNKLNGWIGLSIITSDLLLCCMNNIAKYIIEIALNKRGAFYFKKKTDFCTLFMLFRGSYVWWQCLWHVIFHIIITIHIIFVYSVLKGMNRRFPYGFYVDYRMI